MSFVEASRTTLEEFQIYDIAYAIQQEDKRFNAAIQSWFNQSVKATKGRGKNTKSAYKNFTDFYDHADEFNRLFEPPELPKQVLSIAEKNRLMNSVRKGGG
ncbi:hypothetical protein [Streptococcus jiangjianxini]|uniref:hypothetical protein n=1 Tax=Streptococcus jiangjianxini TaxID=3161189 RepID=UPI0032ED8651